MRAPGPPRKLLAVLEGPDVAAGFVGEWDTVPGILDFVEQSLGPPASRGGLEDRD
jgi:hypothetical protein